MTSTPALAGVLRSAAAAAEAGPPPPATTAAPLPTDATPSSPASEVRVGLFETCSPPPTVFSPERPLRLVSLVLLVMETPAVAEAAPERGAATAAAAAEEEAAPPALPPPLPPLPTPTELSAWSPSKDLSLWLAATTSDPPIEVRFGEMPENPASDGLLTTTTPPQSSEAEGSSLPISPRAVATK